MAGHRYRRLLSPPRGSFFLISELPGLARRILVYLGERRLKTSDGIDVWPVHAFLRAAADKTLWP